MVSFLLRFTSRLPAIDYQWVSCLGRSGGNFVVSNNRGPARKRAARFEFGGKDRETGRPAGRSRSRAYAGHFLRAGYCTQAYLNDVPELSIMRQSRHRSLFRNNPAARLGL
jgi:hypothetical protein